MRPFVLPLLFIGASVTMTMAQPMSGAYTVGGDAPDFAVLQDAANALKGRGVSGPVTMNIRPGTYMRQGSPGPVMRLDTVVTGTSPTNRVTIQPDVAAGGTPGNVILQIDCDVNTDFNTDREIVYVGADYFTFRNLTFRDADSLDSPARFLLRATTVVFANTTIEGLIVDGCTFVGTPYFTHGQQFGTDFGIFALGALQTGAVRNCHFSNLLRAISLNIEANIAFTPPGDSLRVEENRFDHIFPGSTGSGNPLGTAIEVLCYHPTVRRNVVSQSTGSLGIRVVAAVAGSIDRNYVQGAFRNGQIVADPASGVATDSLMVVNNIMIGQGTFAVRTGNTRVFHNTIIHADPFGSSGMEIIGAHCRVINNILQVTGGFVAYNQIGAVDLLSDHNLFFSTSDNFARVPAGQYYATLADYQSATGMDANSHFHDVSFDSDSLGIHLNECEAQEPGLDGIPLAQVPVDFYGTTRDSVTPFVGAVEGVRLPFNMFAAPFKTALPGFALSLAQGRFEDVWGSGIAVPDWDNRRVVLFHNDGETRTFVHSGTVPTGFRPTLVRFYDLDGDNHQDLIVAGDTSAFSLEVFWGDGTGSFSGPSVVETWGRVRSFRPGPRYATFSTIVTMENNGFHSLFGYVMNTPGRQLCHDVQHTGTDDHVDTLINTSVQDFVIADLEPNQHPLFSFVAPGLSGVSNVIPKVLVFNVEESTDLAAHCSQAEAHFSSGDGEFPFPAAPYTNSCAIAAGDFDGDGDNDFVTTGASDDFCLFIRNQGNPVFDVDTIPASAARGLVALDFENDGDLDVVTVNRTLDDLGITVFLNDGTGHFSEKRNCHFPFASGTPDGIVAADFDADGKTDIAVVSRSPGAADSLFVLYNLGGFNGTTSVAGEPVTESPGGFTLRQNYPNPFNPSTRIAYSLPSQSHVTVTIWNMLGQEIALLVDDEEVSGDHVLEWNGRSSLGTPVGSGVYFCRVEAAASSARAPSIGIRKMLMLK